MEVNKVYNGDSLEVLKTFPEECIDMCVTSPPYWGLRDYGVDGQLGLEPHLLHINSGHPAFIGVSIRSSGKTAK